MNKKFIILLIIILCLPLFACGGGAPEAEAPTEEAAELYRKLQRSLNQPARDKLVYNCGPDHRDLDRFRGSGQFCGRDLAGWHVPGRYFLGRPG